MQDTSSASLLFATPVIADRLEDPALDAALEQAILARRDADSGHGALRPRSWRSDNGFLSWGGEAAARLVAHALEIANARTIIKEDRLEADYHWGAQAWANVAEPGAGSAAELYPDSYWSAIYCVRADAGTGGELVLHDPRSPMMEMNAPHLWYADGGIQREALIAIPAGALILFPSWLRRAVRPWEGEGLRIWIAMNLSVTAA